MEKIILYTPILEPSKGCWFSVNGATNRNRDEAIRLASRHSSVISGEAKIARVDESEEWDE